MALTLTKMNYPVTPTAAYGGTLRIRSSETGRPIPLYTDASGNSAVSNPLFIDDNGNVQSSYWYEGDVYFEFYDINNQHINTVRLGGEYGGGNGGGGGIAANVPRVWHTRNASFERIANYGISFTDIGSAVPLNSFLSADTNTWCSYLVNANDYTTADGTTYRAREFNVNPNNFTEHVHSGDIVIDIIDGNVGLITNQKPGNYQPTSDNPSNDAQLYIYWVELGNILSYKNKSANRSRSSLFVKLDSGSLLDKTIGNDNVSMVNNPAMGTWYADADGTLAYALNADSVITVATSGVIGSGNLKAAGVINQNEPSNKSVGMLWMQSAVSGSPNNLANWDGVQLWNGTSWVASTYTSTDWDLWANANDNTLWFYVNGVWEQLDVELDVSNFYTKSEIDNLLNLKANTVAQTVQGMLSNNVGSSNLVIPPNGTTIGDFIYDSVLYKLGVMSDNNKASVIYDPKAISRRISSEYGMVAGNIGDTVSNVTPSAGTYPGDIIWDPVNSTTSVYDEGNIARIIGKFNSAAPNVRVNTTPYHGSFYGYYGASMVIYDSNNTYSVNNIIIDLYGSLAIVRNVTQSDCPGTNAVLIDVFRPSVRVGTVNAGVSSPPSNSSIYNIANTSNIGSGALGAVWSIPYQFCCRHDIIVFNYPAATNSTYVAISGYDTAGCNFIFWNNTSTTLTLRLTTGDVVSTGGPILAATSILFVQSGLGKIRYGAFSSSFWS